MTFLTVLWLFVSVGVVGFGWGYANGLEAERRHQERWREAAMRGVAERFIREAGRN